MIACVSNKVFDNHGRSMPRGLWRQVKRIGPVGFIVLLHVGFFYALSSGLLRQATQALPNEIFATFITPDTPAQPEPSKPAPVPKTVAIIKKAVTPLPVTPVAATAVPSQQSITVAPQLAEPITPVEAAAAPSAPAPPKTISGVAYIQPPQTEYPLLAKRMREEGKVLLRVLVNEKGQPGKIEVQTSSGSDRLDEAARRAVSRALFKPYIEDGSALAVYVIVPIKFQLDN